MGRGGRSDGGSRSGGSRGFSSSRSSSGNAGRGGAAPQNSSRGTSSSGRLSRGGTAPQNSSRGKSPSGNSNKRGAEFGKNAGRASSSPGENTVRRREKPSPSRERVTPPERMVPPPPPERMAPPPPRRKPRRHDSIFSPETVVFVEKESRNDTWNTGDTYAYQSEKREKKKGTSGCCIIVCVFLVWIVIAFCGLVVDAGKAAISGDVRKKLEADACITTDLIIEDELDWISDTRTVKDGIDYFYRKTGVQPYLLICDNIEGKKEEITDEEAESYLQGLYESMYEDEGHMIFAFMEYEDSQYITFLYTGRLADKVIDADAREMILNNVDKYYSDSSLSDEEYFEKIFHVSADEIMADAGGYMMLVLCLVVVCVVIVIIIAAGVRYVKSKEQRQKEEKELEDILNTPEGMTGDSENHSANC